jgi:DNA-binding beta-propeller fold protein YncE
LLLAAVAVALSARGGLATFTTFESGHVRPLALSPDGTRLFAVNTPDDHLEIFLVEAGTGTLTHETSVPVGLEPVAVAARSNTEVWVVNHLSDSVSIVDVGSTPPRVVRTLLVGDEPRDVVFAGTGSTRAFITAAHRGQNRPGDPQLTTEGIGRADVWVFDTTSLGPTSLGGTPLSVLTLFTDTPRALAVSPDGNTVYAAGFHTGNRTTAISEGAVCDGGAGAPACSVFGSTMPGGLPLPNANFQSLLGPETGLIVRFDPVAGHWEDELGRPWDNAVRLALPDRDVFAINASNLAATPASFVGVGTVLFNMVANPVSGKVYVSNTEARNEVRFEGPGTAASTVRGHLHEARITVLDGASVLPRHLNPHIDYDVVPSPPGIKDASLATPLGMAVTSDGATLYVAAFGSSKVGIFDTTELENDSFTPSPADHIAVTGGGPSGLVLHEAADRLYVFTRFDNAISVVDTTTATQIAHHPMHNPEPAVVVDGRHVLYDAQLSSSNGEAACASCHVFGDFDSLAWDLGNPDDVLLNNPNPFEVGSGNPFHPMKGPMTTQSLRGLANHGPMHWRGDRTGGNDPGGNALDENAAFNEFIVAFDGLLGRGGPIDTAAMQAFTDFILQVTYPPNPIRALDDTLTPSELAGSNLFFGPITDGVRNCDGCHVTNPAAGFFGGNGESTIEGEPQEFKVPHLRNLYQKVGMFGMPAVPFFRTGDNGPMGDQIRGFGFLHDGSVDTLFRFHSANAFSFGPPEAANLEQFMLAFDSNLKPIVGQQVTLTSTNAAAAGPRIGLLLAQQAAGACELTVKGVLAGEQRGWLRLVSGNFQSDRASEPTLTDAQLRAHATTLGHERTYLCVPPGSGTRVGLDRDEDGFFDRDELDAGSDPADPSSTPSGGTTTTTTTTTSTTTTSTSPPSQVFIPIPTKKLVLKDRSAPPADPNRRKVTFKSDTRGSAHPYHIVPPLQGSPDDPRTVGVIVAVYNSVGPGGELVPVGLPPSGWRATGLNTYKYKGASTAGITAAILKPDQIAFKGGKAGWNYTLNEPAQGRVATVIIVGSTIYCSDAPAKATGNPPSTASNDRIDKFVAQPNTAAPFFCLNP